MASEKSNVILAKTEAQGRLAVFENAAWALVMTLLVALAARMAGGFYYDLNDDVLIKDILSGVYTGQPEARTIQILYPLGLLLALLYHIPGIPVFGLFLCLCQFGSIFLIAYRTMECLESPGKKFAAVAAQGLFWLGACLEHLVFLQYTVSAGMLGAAAIFWMATSGKSRTFVGFLKENIVALICYWICFCLRSEMGMLLLPLAGVTGFCKWFSGGHPFAKENLCRYLGLFGVLAVGIGICLGADRLAYGSGEWQEFGRFFDARTTIYDYQRDVVENYEENRAIYDALEMSETQQKLLKNYNFGADDRIDGAFMEQLAELAQKRENGGLFRKDLRTGLWELVRGHFLSASDFCLNAVTILLGVLLFFPGFAMKKKRNLWIAALITACGSALWMFVILRDRVPTRISTPLYLGMAAALGGLLVAQNTQHKLSEYMQRAGAESARRARTDLSSCFHRYAVMAAALGMIVVSLLTIPGQFTDVKTQADQRKETNLVNEAVMDYCSKFPEILFLEDVYSTVSFSEKIGVDRDKPFNYDLLGGWLVKSPLTEEKLRAFGLDSMGSAVVETDRVRLLAEAGTGFLWLEEYLAELGIEVRAKQVETIADGAVEVYQIVAGK